MNRRMYALPPPSAARTSGRIDWLVVSFYGGLAIVYAIAAGACWLWGRS